DIARMVRDYIRSTSGGYATQIEASSRSFSGSPLVASIAGATVREGLISLHEFVNGLRDFQAAGVTGPSGAPVSVLNAKTLGVEAISGVNDELLRRLSAHPEEMRQLSPR